MWKVKFDQRAYKEFKKLDRRTQKEILDYMDQRVTSSFDPRRFGKALSYDKRGLWRYRIGDYRVICQIQDDAWIVLALKIGHRRAVYDE